MSDERPAGVRFGALVPSLAHQGFHDPSGHLQRDADAIDRLWLRGLLPDGQASLARKRLSRKLYDAWDAEKARRERDS